MLSSRYAPAICVALFLALIPTIIHSYAGAVVDDGLTVKAIPSTLGAYASMPTRRPDDWGARRFESKDWIERQYSATGDSAVLTAVRSYDLKALYHHPELAVAYRAASFATNRTEFFPEQPDMPVHVLCCGESNAVAMYVLHYDGRFVADPIAFQIRTATELLFSGRKPMTLIFVRDETPATDDALKLPAAQLLRDAVHAFVAQASSGK